MFKCSLIECWLVVSTPLKNMSSSVGMMTFPINMESHSKFHSCSSHHQPEFSSQSHNINWHPAITVSRRHTNMFLDPDGRCNQLQNIPTAWWLVSWDDDIPTVCGHLSVISTYNPIYRMYNPIYNQLYLVNGHNCNIWRLWDVLMGKSSILILYNSG